jgi:hypothetical protein
MNTARIQRSVDVLSALSFGLLGWCVAHGITYWLLSHPHIVDTGETVRHNHELLPAASVAAACAAAGSLLAVFVVSLRTRTSTRSHQGWWQRDMRHAAALSTTAYLAAELTEHQLVGGDQLPGPLVALIGVCVYLLIGASTSLLWRSSTTAARSLATRLLATPRRRPLTLRPQPVMAPTPALLPRLSAHAHFGRAPPALPA